MFKVDYDAAAGVIRCTSGGLMSAADVHECAMKVHESMQRSYAEFGNVAMLVISTESFVQPGETIDATKNQQRRFRPDDRIAIVAPSTLPSTLSKMQMARTFPSDRHRTFASEPEALAWLAAERRGLGKAAPPARAA